MSKEPQRQATKFYTVLRGYKLVLGVLLRRSLSDEALYVVG
jgi:hypothetical protein